MADSGFLDEGEGLNSMLAGIVSPQSADALVGPPPDSPPPSQPGVSTQRTGNLAAAPKQAIAKNQDTAIGRAQYTGVSRPANDGFGATTSVQPAAAQPIQPAQPVRPAQGVQPAQPMQAAQPIQPAQVNPDPTSSLRPGGTSPMPALPQTGLQPVQGPSQLDKDQSRLSMLTNTGSGVSQIQNPFLRGLARVGDVAGSILAPGVAAAIPGTTLHHQQLLGQQQQIVGNDQAQQQAAAQTADTQQKTALDAAKAAGTAPIQVTPEMVAANPALSGLVGQTVSQQTLGGVAKAATTGTLRNQGQIDRQDDPDSYQAKNAQSLSDVRQTQQVLNQAKADAANADPSTPAGRMAIAKLRAAEDGHSAAMIRAQAGMINAQAGAFGTYNGQALPGAMLTDQGTPVGAHFQGNVRPTGQERNKADMAASAAEQLSDIKSIMQKHPTLFGPGYGQASAFRQWIGSQDPDAQRFIAARTIAGDHLAGTFGGRSEAALHALDNAIGQFKDNPKAAISGIDQLTKANTRFQQAGTVRTVGSNAAEAPPVKPGGSLPGHEVWVRGANGKLVKQ
jgi:hypothetical protein